MRAKGEETGSDETKDMGEARWQSNKEAQRCEKDGKEQRERAERMEGSPCWPRVAGQTDLQWLALGLLGDVTGIFLQAFNAHHHGFCLCEAAYQARKQARQGQGIRQHEAHQP